MKLSLEFNLQFEIIDLQSTLIDLVFLIAPLTDILRLICLVLCLPPECNKSEDLLDKDLTRCSSKY